MASYRSENENVQYAYNEVNTVREDQSNGQQQDDDEGSERIEVDDDGSADFTPRYQQQQYRKKYTMISRQKATEYYCELCKKVFKHPSKIAEHLRKHTGERPFLCEVCGARFTQGGALKVHLRGHMGQLPYKCAYCDRQFSTLYNQKNHEEVHQRGGRIHSDRRISDSSQNMGNNKFTGHKSENVVEDRNERNNMIEEGAEEEASMEVYECCVDGCGYQHTIRAAVEEHVSMEHAHLWDEEGGHDMMGEGGDEQDEGEGGGNDHLQHQQLLHQQSQQLQHMQMQMQIPDEQYQDYAYYEYIEHDGLVSADDVVVMTEEEVAAASSSTLLHGEESIDNHQRSTLVIQADEHLDDMNTKQMVGDRRTKRMLTLGRTMMDRGDKMYADDDRLYMESAPPQPTYEVEVITSRTGMPGPSSMEQVDVHDEDDDPQPVFSEMAKMEVLVEGDEDEEEEVEDVMIPVDDNNRVRLLADPRPPSKGRRTMEKWEDNMDQLEEVEVDANLLNEVLPQNRNPPGSNRRKKKNGPPVSRSRNLDWIIDAVATGVDVDLASPHNRRKPTMHTCIYCGKVDKYPSKIEAHMRTHTGEKPFKCELCDATFTQRTPMRMHMRRHFDQRPFKCAIEGCTSRFISQALLNSHVNSKHYNNKRFVCLKGCGRWFASARNQRHHELKCAHNINRTTINTDYSMDGGSRYVVESSEDVRYLEDGMDDDVLEEEDEDEDEYKIPIHHDDMMVDDVDVVNDPVIGNMQPNFL